MALTLNPHCISNELSGMISMMKRYMKATLTEHLLITRLAARDNATYSSPALTKVTFNEMKIE